MNRKRFLALHAAVCALLTLGAAPDSARGQSTDALLDKLVEKGILTVKEANDLKAETDKNFTTALAAKNRMPEWVTSLKFNGDFRGRFEQNNADNSQYYERDRFRYRVRFGVVATLEDDFEIGFRLASGDPMSGGAINSNPGGLPITANQTMSSLESSKFVWMDAAYAKWTPIHNPAWTVTGIIGKMDNPFQFSNMVWDHDITPEGAAFQIACNITDRHTLKGNGAFFVLDEINQGVGTLPTLNPTRDPYLYGFQVLMESKWTPKFETALGAAVFDIAHKDSINAKAQPFYNSGNTRDPSGFLVYNLNPIIGTGSATYKLSKFPFYQGEFPIKATCEYVNNPGAPSNNEAFRVGATFGKAGKKKTWEINYRYQRLEADAWFDALVDDDNGGFYAIGNPQLTGTGKLNGWYGGTNVRGHFMQASYSFTDYCTFTFTYYLNDLIINAPGQSSDATHFMADLMWKF